MARIFEKPDRDKYAQPRDLEVNDEFTPASVKVRTVPDEPVVDAFYAYPTNIPSATDDVNMAVWGWNEQGRYLKQIDKLKDE